MIHGHNSFPTSQRQGGYSIVEMGLVLAILGLLLGSILIPLGNRQRTERVEVASVQLEQIKDAIVGYTRNHRNSPYAVILSDTSATIDMTAEIPGGRPYLPCPDLDGDGLEDRYPLPAANISVGKTLVGEVVEDLDSGTGTVVATLALPDIQLATITVSSVRSANELTPGLGVATGSAGYGMCDADKGMVPWATLGTPAEDPWGNRFTYRVDPIFAHAALGFGAESRSDMLDPRMPLAVTVTNSIELTTYMRRPESYRYGYSSRWISSFVNVPTGTSCASPSGNNRYVCTEIDELPGLVCTNINTSSNDGCSLMALRNGDINATDLLNATASAPMTLFDVLHGIAAARLYDTNDITSGMAFSVASHGPNGWGAVPHQDGDNFEYFTSASGALGQSLACLTIEGLALDWQLAEMENADSPANNLCVDAVPSSNTAASAPAPFPHSSSFLDVPTSRTATLEFDDILIHMSDQELLGAVKKLGVDLGQAWLPPILQ